MQKKIPSVHFQPMSEVIRRACRDAVRQGDKYAWIAKRAMVSSTTVCHLVRCKTSAISVDTAEAIWMAIHPDKPFVSLRSRKIQEEDEE